MFYFSNLYIHNKQEKYESKFSGEKWILLEENKYLITVVKCSLFCCLFFLLRYAQLCQNLLEQNAETGEQFSQEFLPSLLFLLVDPVPNVRLSLARTLAQCILLSGVVTAVLVVRRTLRMSSFRLGLQDTVLN